MKPQIPVSIHSRSEGPLYQLITNVTKERREVAMTSDLSLVRTREYLREVLVGDGKRAYCPFVEQIEAQNGYHVFVDDAPPSEIDLPSIVERLEKEFGQLSGARTFAGQQLDVTSVIAAFSNPAAMCSEFCTKLDELRDGSRLEILKQGLMLAQMHPFHPRGEQSRTGKLLDEKKYQAGIPLLIVRRMHAPDFVFMRTEEEMQVFRTYFPSHS